MTAPEAAIEPNYSVFDWAPPAEALWAVYRKRRVAWQLQRAGIPVFVDLCMPASSMHLALLGVPAGWKAYATRGFEKRFEDVAFEYGVAAKHCGSAPLFVVYGGGQRVRALVLELPGAVYVPDHMARVRGDG